MAEYVLHCFAQSGNAYKPALALTMIERAIAARVPFSFVAADSVYGVGDIEMALRRAAENVDRQMLEHLDASAATIAFSFRLLPTRTTASARDRS